MPRVFAPNVAFGRVNTMFAMVEVDQKSGRGSVAKEERRRKRELGNMEEEGRANSVANISELFWLVGG